MVSSGKRVLLVLAALLGAYLVVRAGIEFVNVDYAHPARYAADWGGPSLAGVLAVHCGPGIAVLAGLGVLLLRRRSTTGGRR